MKKRGRECTGQKVDWCTTRLTHPSAVSFTLDVNQSTSQQKKIAANILSRDDWVSSQQKKRRKGKRGNERKRGHWKSYNPAAKHMEDITQCLTVTFERLQFTRLENWPLQVSVKVEVEADSCHQLQLTPEDCCWKRSVRNVRDIFIILFIHSCCWWWWWCHKLHFGAVSISQKQQQQFSKVKSAAAVSSWEACLLQKRRSVRVCLSVWLCVGLCEKERREKRKEYDEEK